ncbi:MAG: hypothetical protein AAF391_11450 [Bacteroidota bacterium]
MKIRYFLLIAFAVAFVNGIAQTKEYALKKGQSFDILLFNTIPNTKSTLDRYFKSAIPVAQKYGYMPQKGFKVSLNPLQGNYWPKTVIIGLWSDYAKREDFITEITNEVPKFHEMRRTIWSSFFLTYWEVKQDQKVEVNTERFNVMTAYWEEDSEAFKQFKRYWKHTAKRAGGEIILELEEGKSPVGYYYNPDHLTITSWESQEAFEEFYEKNLEMDHAGVKHVNQFIIE